jgi:pimeloyl-ACP methyl ester carboxylesterase
VSYLDANGVHTYYDEHGAGDPLLLMHGGLSSADDLEMQTPALAERYRVILPERRAHGRTADVDEHITYDLMADDTVAFMEALGTGPAHLVGWSDGGNVALLVAIKRPDLVRKVVTVGPTSPATATRRAFGRCSSRTGQLPPRCARGGSSTRPTARSTSPWSSTR